MRPSGILVVNAGSSSIKFAMFEVVDSDVPGLLYHGLVDRVDTSHAHFHASDGGGRALADSKFEAKSGKTLDHTAMLEAVHGIGSLLAQGWKPRRTLVYTVWDGEEPGLLGSTEWVEQHQDELRRHAVMYLNSDSSARGYLNVSGSHTLERAVNQVEREIQDPEKHISVWKRAYLRRVGRAASSEDREELRDRADLRLGALGDGSDYTAFLDYTGVGPGGREHGHALCRC